ncbi:MAG: NAD(P)-binding protein [Actinomycetota bacterium]|nr:NAD(P)-binding protein [Actinomycetota bacterium]
MAENIVVGAGLSGLVAAINLVREGREVLVLEREKCIGGSSLYHPSPQGTPVDIEALKRYIGVDISPALSYFESKTFVFGKEITVDSEAISARLLERGPRSTSLDSLLYDIAVKEGVRFKFGQELVSQDDFAKLPPDTIVATGLHFEGFDSMRVDYLTSFHYAARKKTGDDKPPHVTIYEDDFTPDYAYTTSLNGIVFAHCFARVPIGNRTLEAFKESIYRNEGLEFDEWIDFTFPVPAARISNPSLFSGNKILAGTIGGFIEPFMFFGIHGALVSGKIAAMAVMDKDRAIEEARIATSAFKGAYILQKVLRYQPRFSKEFLLRFAIEQGLKMPVLTRVAKDSIPGWLNCKRAVRESFS